MLLCNFKDGTKSEKIVIFTANFFPFSSKVKVQLRENKLPFFPAEIETSSYFKTISKFKIKNAMNLIFQIHFIAMQLMRSISIFHNFVFLCHVA